MDVVANQSIEKLVSIVKDYKRITFDEGHVRKWLDQFDKEDHNLILDELSLILEKTYVSEEKEKTFLKNQCKKLIEFKENGKEYKFLNIQSLGESQKHLLERFDEVIKENSQYSLSSLEASSQIENYVYLDDAMYTGNKVKRDIENWSAGINVSSVKELYIIVYASHEKNLKYIKSELEKMLPNSKIVIDSVLKFNNNNGHECYSLSGDAILSENGKTYVDQIVDFRSEPQEMYYPLLRKVKKYDEGYFSNDENRKRIELIFFEKGLEITFSAKEQFRPFGYDFQHTLGFGSYLINYRNIANNCPAVFWWGDIKGHKGINNWYPLFPRKANN